MDRTVLDAYGWTDIQPTSEFLLDYDDEEDEEESVARVVERSRGATAGPTRSATKFSRVSSPSTQNERLRRLREDRLLGRRRQDDDEVRVPKRAWNGRLLKEKGRYFRFRLRAKIGIVLGKETKATCK